MKILSTANNASVMDTKMMRSVEAVFCMPLVTALMSACMVGMGLGVGGASVAGSHMLPVASNTIPI